MRLIGVWDFEDYKPLDRGTGFPQYYENGDHYVWWNPMDFHYAFWHRGLCWEASHNLYPSNDEVDMLCMGGEL
jgi:hypothetical protein